MAYLNLLLLWLHLASLAVAGAAVFGMPVVMANMAGVSADVRPRVGAIARRLSMMSRGALVVLLPLGRCWSGSNSDRLRGSMSGSRSRWCWCSA